MSPRNPRLAELRRLLGSRAARLQHSSIVVEGPRLLAEALDASLVVREVFVEDPDAWPGATLVRPGTLDRLGDAVTSQGVLAVVEAPDQTLVGGGGGAGRPLAERWHPGSSPLVLVLVDVADPGNAGTLLRSAEAAGAAAVVFTGRGVDPLSPKVVRAAAGALFRLPFAVTAGIDDALAWLTETGLTTVATVVEGGVDLHRADLSGPLAVLLGNEAHGLPAAVTSRCERLLSIPMAGRVESLNVAMAGTVVLFEAWRQRRITASGTDLAGTGGCGQALTP